MPVPADDVVEVELATGARIRVHPLVADRVRGVDATGHLLIPLGDLATPVRHADGTEYLIPLTWCCQAGGEGADVASGVVCRGVNAKYRNRNSGTVRCGGLTRNAETCRTGRPRAAGQRRATPARFRGLG